MFKSPKLLFALLCGLACLFSCKSSNTSMGQQIPQENIEKVAKSYDQCSAFIADEINAVALEIIKNSSDRSIQKNAVTMRQYVTKTLREVNDPDPREAIIDTWVFLQRLANYLTKGDGKNIFGDQQDLVINKIDGIAIYMKKLIEEYMDPEKVATLKQDINTYSTSNPIVGVFKDSTKQGRLFSDLMEFPLAPFKAFSAIGRGGQSIEDISVTVERFTDIVEDLPEDVRWQVQALIMSLEENQLILENTKSVSKIADSSVQLSSTLENYPEKIRTEFEKINGDLDKLFKQLALISADIHKSSENVKISSENFNATGQEINKAMDKVPASIQEIKASSKALTQAAKAVSLTIKDVQNITEFFKEDSQDSTLVSDASVTPSNIEEPKDPFLVQLKDGSIELQKAANEITTGITQVRAIIESQELLKGINAIEQITDKTLAETRKESQEVINTLFWKCINQ